MFRMMFRAFQTKKRKVFHLGLMLLVKESDVPGIYKH